jgi:SAM-dependent methyltransferase
MDDEWYQIAQPEHFWMKWRFDILKRFIPNDFTWGKTLEVGCGYGIAGKQIEDHYGCTVSGCDLNISALRNAVPSKGKHYFYDINQRHANLKENFDTVLLLDVLEHIESPVDFLKSAAFHIKPSGRIILNTPAIQLFYSRYDRAMGHLRRYSIPALSKELRLAGFSITCSTYWGLSMVPLILARKLVLCFVSDKQTIRVGFRPACKLVNHNLELCRRFECAFFPRTFFGTSLLVMAQKKK